MNIGKQAFGLNALKSVTFSNSLQSIGDNAFTGNDLTSIVLPNSLVSIGSFAFEENDLKTVVIPALVSKVGISPFKRNQLLRSITVDGRNAEFTSIGGVLFDKTGTKLLAYPNAKGSEYSIPSSVIEIADGAFSSGPLTKVTFPRFLKKIGSNAFEYNRLISLSIPNSVTNVGNNAFAGNQLSRVIFHGNAIPGASRVFYRNPCLSNIVVQPFAIGWPAEWSGIKVDLKQKAALCTIARVNGVAKVNRTLKVDAGVWAGYPAPKLTYQWITCSKANTANLSVVKSSCKRIPGATKRTLKVGKSQKGKYLAVWVTGKSDGTASARWLSLSSYKVK
jgi:hypothetical protein